MTPRAVAKLARRMSEFYGRTVHVVYDEEGPLLAWRTNANGRSLIGAPEDVREDNGRGFVLNSTNERIAP